MDDAPQVVTAPDMSDAILKLIEAKPEKMEEALPVINEEVERFSAYMTSLNSVAAAPLSNPEKALIRTYLVAKVRGRL